MKYPPKLKANFSLFLFDITENFYLETKLD